MDTIQTPITPQENIGRNVSNHIGDPFEQNQSTSASKNGVKVSSNDEIGSPNSGHNLKPGILERAVNFINKYTGIKTKWADLSRSMKAVTVIKLILLTAIIGGLIYFGVIALLGAGTSIGAVALAKSLGFSGMKTLSIFSGNITFSKASLGILAYEGTVFGGFLLVSLASGYADKKGRSGFAKINSQGEGRNNRKESESEQLNNKNVKGGNEPKTQNKELENNKSLMSRKSAVEKISIYEESLGHSLKHANSHENLFEA